MVKKCSDPHCGFEGETNFCPNCGKGMLEEALGTKTVAEDDEVGGPSRGAEASFQSSVDTGEMTPTPGLPSQGAGETQTQVCVSQDEK